MHHFLNKLIKNILPKLKLLFSYKYFGFIDGHGYLDSNQKLKLKKLIFNEDEKIIKPIIQYLKRSKYNVSGPLSADTAFLKNNRKNFDVILGMYHDQVLTPIKTLFEYDAINITLGLPFTRISPDHGPNQKMLGENISNPLSLIKAISFLEKN